MKFVENNAATDESFEEWEDRVKQEIPKRKKRTSNEPVLLQEIAAEEANYEWIWENIIAKGHITILSALFKTGKSTFLRCFLKACYDEEEFIGMPTKKAGVLILTEESATEWVQRREEFSLDREDGTTWIWTRPYYAKLTYEEWVGFVTVDLLNFCKEHEIDMVCVDTLNTFWATTNEDKAPEVEQNLKPFIALTESKIAVFLIMQDNKGGGKFGRNIRGSSALPAFADEIIVFGRPESENALSRRREIVFFGRLYSSDDSLIVTYQEDHTYTSGLPKWQFSKKARLEIITKIFEEAPVPLDIKTVQKLWDESLYGDKPHIDSFRVYVTELFRLGVLVVAFEEIHVKAKTMRYGITGRGYDTTPTPENEPTETEPSGEGLGAPFRTDKPENKPVNDTKRKNEYIYKNHSVPFVEPAPDPDFLRAQRLMKQEKEKQNAE